MWIGSEGLKGPLAPLDCRWCGNNVVDNGARAALKWDNPAAADAWSNVSAAAAGGLSFGTLLLAEYLDDANDRTGPDLLFVVEAVALAGDGNVLAKMSGGRARPSRHGDADDNLSFYSGHTTTAFALATAAGTVATLRGYRFAPLVWASGLTAAALTGYLRIAGDRHWLSDVALGATAGSLAGIAIPLLLHSPESQPRSVATRSTASRALTANARTSAAPVVTLAFTF